MIRPELIRDIKSLSREELQHANSIFPLFHSAHEGYGVLKEEIEEAEEEIQEVRENFGILWDTIRENGLGFESIAEIEDHAIKAAAECIQVAAMCKKYRESLNN